MTNDTKAATDERELRAFEDAVRSVWTPGYACLRYETGEYVDPQVRTFLRIWQSARAQLAAPPAELVSMEEVSETAKAAGVDPFIFSKGAMWAIGRGSPPASQAPKVAEDAMAQILARAWDAMPTPHVSDDLAECIAALAAPAAEAQPSGAMTEAEYNRLVDNLMAQLGEISEALGISEEDQSCANGNDEILAAIEELKGEIDDLNVNDERDVWPGWAEAILKTVREHSGYDGYDDQDGIDLPAEVAECLSELAAQADRARSTAAAAEAGRDALDARRWRTMRALILASNMLGEYGMDYCAREKSATGGGYLVSKTTETIDAAIDAQIAALAGTPGAQEGQQ